MIGAGAVVTNNVPANAIVTGNPARISGYVSTLPQINKTVIQPQVTEEADLKLTTRAKFIRLPFIPDLRGSLSFAEIGKIYLSSLRDTS